MKFLLLYLSGLTLLALTSAQEKAGRFYVHPTRGSDDYTGRFPEVKRWGRWRKDGPFATLEGAILQLRARRRFGEYNKVVIYLREGTYAVDSIVLDGRDAGTKIVNYKKEKVVFENTYSIPGKDFEQMAVMEDYTIFTADYNERCSMNAYLSSKRLIRARKPNVKKWTGNNFSGEGPYLQIKDVLHSSPECDRQSSGGFRQVCPDANKLGFVFYGEDIPKSKRNRKSEIDLIVYQSWNAERGRVKKIFKGNSTVLFEDPLRFAIGNHPTSSGWRYIMENALTELDGPGEFYCGEKENKFYVALPKSSHKILKRKGVKIPHQLRQFVLRDTSDIQLEGLHFKKSGYDKQGFVESPAAIEVHNSSHIEITECSFEDMGHTAIYAMSTQNLHVENNVFKSMGYMGVAVDYMNNPDDESTTRDIIITRNTMTQCGMTNMFQPSCIHVRGALNISVTANDIFDTCYSGIRVGWQKAFTQNYVPPNDYVFRVERNHIHHYGKGILNDFGGIYLSTNQEDCKLYQRNEICHLHALVKNNIISNSLSYHYGGSGVHGDCASASVTIESNWMYRLYDGAFLFHCGTNNLALNNVVYHTGKRRLIGTCNNVMRGVNGTLPTQEFTVLGNVFYIQNTEALMWRRSDTWTNDEPFFEENLYYFPLNLDNQTSIFFPKGVSFLEWRQNGQDTSSMIADPQFVSIKQDNYRFRPTSPISQLPVANLNLIPTKEASGVSKVLKKTSKIRPPK